MLFAPDPLRAECDERLSSRAGRERGDDLQTDSVSGQPEQGEAESIVPRNMFCGLALSRTTTGMMYLRPVGRASRSPAATVICSPTNADLRGWRPG